MDQLKKITFFYFPKQNHHVLIDPFAVSACRGLFRRSENREFFVIVLTPVFKSVMASMNITVRKISDFFGFFIAILCVGPHCSIILLVL